MKAVECKGPSGART